MAWVRLVNVPLSFLSPAPIQRGLYLVSVQLVYMERLVFLHSSSFFPAGHNKWSKIKHKKAAADMDKSKVTSKFSRQIIAAVKAGRSANPDLNMQLSSIISNARSAGVPKATIEKALCSGSGNSKNQAAEQVLYEGRGPSGYVLLIEALTDNRNRTRPEIRNILEKHGGSLGNPGSSVFMFEHKGIVQTPKDVLLSHAYTDALELAIDVGAEDVVGRESTKESDCYYYLKCEPSDLMTVCDALQQKGMVINSAKIEYIPKSVVLLREQQHMKALKLVDILYDHDDVMEVYVNFVQES